MDKFLNNEFNFSNQVVRASEMLAGVNGVVSEGIFDSEDLVVFGKTV